MVTMWRCSYPWRRFWAFTPVNRSVVIDTCGEGDKAFSSTVTVCGIYMVKITVS